MRKMFAGMAAALLAAVLFFPCKVDAISAKSAILVDADTGRVLFEKDADERALIASTTKIMTALLICEQCNVLDRMEIPKDAVGIEGSSVYLQEGEVLTLQTLLYGMMLHSGNDAAVALAIYCGGTVEGFVQLMNDKARQLGLEETHFANPNGLDAPNHYATARDLATLAAYAMENPIFAKTVSTKTVTVEGRTFRNHNKLLWRIEGADGVKTGYTRAAGRILVSTASRQCRRLVAVTINAPDDWSDHAQLLNRGFEGYTVCRLVQSGECIGFVEVAGGQAGKVEMVATCDFLYPLADDEEVDVLIAQPGFVYAPVVEGESAGHAYICVNGKAVGKVAICYGKTVEVAPIKEKSLLFRLLEMIK